MRHMLIVVMVLNAFVLVATSPQRQPGQRGQLGAAFSALFTAPHDVTARTFLDRPRHR